MFYPILLLGAIVFLDLCLSGDNVVVIAMAANGLPVKLRGSAINAGMVLAATLRVVLALFATLLLANHWIAFLGGLALLYVAYKLGFQLLSQQDETKVVKQATTFGQAMLLIVLADISMSLDNVLAVAALARNHWFLMMLGIAVSIYFLTVATKWVSGFLVRYPWINWIGLFLIIYVAIGLIFGSYNTTMSTIQN